MKHRGKVLVLCCGSGGAMTGIKRAGWDVTGVDILQLPNPHEVLIDDALTTSLKGYDWYWASPPCARWSKATPESVRDSHPDLIGPIRKRLLRTGKPFVVENVERAPLRQDLNLCGAMFDLPIVRHRVFEIHGFKVPQPEHVDHPPNPVELCGRGARIRVFKTNPETGERYQTLQHVSANRAREIMEMPWAPRRGFVRAVHPRYAEYIAKHVRIKR
jgi:DNA (cytosine-5)-methyltransferase 1